ncbi:MAG: biotin/lipoyl-binding protein [Chloroflexi bacterium]|nr:biotin/lipoyl-binding protein [Chloroflexota bacterium]
MPRCAILAVVRWSIVRCGWRSRFIWWPDERFAMIFTYDHNGQTVTLTLDQQPDGSYHAVIGDRTYTVQAQPLNEGGWLLALGRQRFVVYSAVEGNTRFLSLEGQDYTLTVPDTRAARRQRSAGGGDLTAQMPGQVVDVLVNEGDTVERGQTLVILEAMKMEIRVAAPAAGRVKRLLARKGEVVERGQLLVEIE